MPDFFLKTFQLVSRTKVGKPTLVVFLAKQQQIRFPVVSDQYRTLSFIDHAQHGFQLLLDPFAGMEILTIGVVRYLTQTALLDMMAIDSPTTMEGMKQTTPLRSSIIMFLMMSSLCLCITACRILMFRINHLAFHWIDRPPVYLDRDCVSTVSQAYPKVTVIPKS